MWLCDDMPVYLWTYADICGPRVSVSAHLWWVISGRLGRHTTAMADTHAAGELGELTEHRGHICHKLPSYSQHHTSSELCLWSVVSTEDGPSVTIVTCEQPSASSITQFLFRKVVFGKPIWGDSVRLYCIEEYVGWIQKNIESCLPWLTVEKWIPITYLPFILYVQKGHQKVSF